MHNTIKVFQTIFAAMGLLFLIIESYEIIHDEDVTFHYGVFVALCLIVGVIFFVIDGYYINGILKKKISIKSGSPHINVEIKFGNIFNQKGW